MSDLTVSLRREIQEIIDNAALSETQRSVALQECLGQRSIGHDRSFSSVMDSMTDYGQVISTGYPEIDGLLHGGLRPGISILAAPPGAGKTTLALQLSEQMSAQQVQVVYITNDMAEEELVAKCLSRHSYEIAGKNGMDAASILMSSATLRDTELFQDTVARFRSRTQHLHLVGDQTGTQLADIEFLMAYYGSCGSRCGNTVFVIDFLQNIGIDEPMGDKERVDLLVQTLKKSARKYKLPVLAISSINRMSYSRDLTMDSLKESGGIEFQADLIMGLQFAKLGQSGFDLKREMQKDPREMKLVVLKNRFGAVGGQINIYYLPQYNLLPYNKLTF